MREDGSVGPWSSSTKKYTGLGMHNVFYCLLFSNIRILEESRVFIIIKEQNKENKERICDKYENCDF